MIVDKGKLDLVWAFPRYGRGVFLEMIIWKDSTNLDYEFYLRHVTVARAILVALVRHFSTTSVQRNPKKHNFREFLMGNTFIKA